MNLKEIEEELDGNHSQPGEPLRLGTVRPTGPQQCGYGLESSLCDKSAVWHVWLSNQEGHLLSCDEHYDYIRARNLSRFAELDVHRVGEACNQLNSMFKFTTADDKGFCYVKED